MGDPSVMIDGRRYVPESPTISPTTDLAWDKWIPEVGDMVWMNMDEGPPLGKCIGYLTDPGKPRHGQPVIERTEDETGFLARKKGDRSVVHPLFIWPFEPGSEEHKAAEAKGQFRR